MNTDIFGTM